MKYVCIWLIRLYQKVLSPLKRQPTCRFSPTCSAYAVEAFQKRGFFIGLILTVSRIFRCQPFGKAGWDPVPEKGLRNPKYFARPMTKYYYPEEYGLEIHTAGTEEEQ
ncbi:MAG: membrane protein insertion efficiency factor YidD [Clostridia bacterium]|nr:membrane protein insertion efficiency factor YidD [Clostridia bacterium]